MLSRVTHGFLNLRRLKYFQSKAEHVWTQGLPWKDYESGVIIPLGRQKYITVQRRYLSGPWIGDWSRIDWAQITKNKTRLKRKNRNKKVATSQLFHRFPLLKKQKKFVKKLVVSKHIDLKPMDLEETILQMDLLRTWFLYLFRCWGQQHKYYTVVRMNIGLVESQINNPKKVESKGSQPF